MRNDRNGFFLCENRIKLIRTSFCTYAIFCSPLGQTRGASHLQIRQTCHTLSPQPHLGSLHCWSSPQKYLDWMTLLVWVVSSGLYSHVSNWAVTIGQSAVTPISRRKHQCKHPWTTLQWTQLKSASTNINSHGLHCSRRNLNPQANQFFFTFCQFNLSQCLAVLPPHRTHPRGKPRPKPTAKTGTTPALGSKSNQIKWQEIAKRKHATAGVRWSSPTQLLICRSIA